MNNTIITPEYESTERSQSVPAVNFYVLSDSDLDTRMNFVYRLVEKVHNTHIPTLIVTADKEQLHNLDRLLWVAKPQRFIPHEIITDSLVQPLPDVLLTDDTQSLSRVQFSPQVVIDISYDSTPLFFPKIMLVANQNPDILPNARMKYQSYINSGITPAVHKIQIPEQE